MNREIEATKLHEGKKKYGNKSSEENKEKKKRGIYKVWDKKEQKKDDEDAKEEVKKKNDKHKLDKNVRLEIQSVYGTKPASQTTLNQ